MEQETASKAGLTKREHEVAALVAEGLTNRAIAQRMFISERTVDGHLEHIREKLGVGNRAGVAAWYVARPANGGAGSGARVPSRTLTRRRSFELLLLVAVFAAVVLVAGLLVPQFLGPTTPAGPALISYAGPANEPFSRPAAVAIAANGFVYVADTDHFAIRKFDPKTLAVTLVAGDLAQGDFVDGGDAHSTAIGNPTGLVVTPDGQVYFANGFIVGRVGRDETVHLVLQDPDIKPVALALGADGTLYIVDHDGNRIWQRSPAGNLTRVAGNGQMSFGGDNASALDAQLNHPSAVAVAPNGDVYIADEGNNRIRRIDVQTNVITTLAGSYDIYGFGGDGGSADHALLSLPLGVAVGPDGNVYISDTGNNRVRRVGKDHKITTVLGGDGVFYGPGGLAITASGDVYVADIGGNRIVLVRGLAAR